jgi:hypothetical protein
MVSLMMLLFASALILLTGCSSSDGSATGVSGAGFGVSSGSMDGVEDIAFHGLELARGDVVRYRVEPESADSDVVIGVLADHELAEAASSEYAATFPDEAADFYTVPASQRFHGDLDDLADADAYNDVDAGRSGDAEASFFLVNQDGTYTIAVGTALGSTPGPFRLVVERWASTLTDAQFSDAEQLTTILDQDFFTDPAFYSQTGRYDPDP